MQPAAFQATFSDFRIVKGRKVCQFIFEVAMEKSDDALEAMGGLPRGDESRWVGIARLQDPGPRPTTSGTSESTRAASPGTKAKRRFDELPLSQQAGILCNDVAFQQMATQRLGSSWWDRADEQERVDASADYLRERCGVRSRAEIEKTPAAAEKFAALKEHFNIAVGRTPAP